MSESDDYIAVPSFSVHDAEVGEKLSYLLDCLFEDFPEKTEEIYDVLEANVKSKQRMV